MFGGIQFPWFNTFMKNITFSFVTKADKNELLQLLASREKESNELHGKTGEIVLTQGNALFDQLISEPNTKVLVGKLENEIVATVTLYYLPRIRTGGYVVMFEDVLVKKDYRGQGIGSQLISFAIETCRADRRVKKIKLGSRKEATSVHHFYEKLGFKYQENLLQLELKS